MSTDYVKLAEARWPRRRIIGDAALGRYAVTQWDGRVVYLCATTTQQHEIALGIDNVVKEDLGLAQTLDKIRDVESPEERRERRREERARV